MLQFGQKQRRIKKAMIVVKLDSNGQEKVRYEAQRYSINEANCVAVRAEWQTPTIKTETTTFARGDFLHEFFYSDRWYNVFTLYAGETGMLKGWYCNVTRPTEITDTEIRWTDLELDVWVAPDGTVTVLDEAEFWEIALSEQDRQNCLDALTAIKELANSSRLPTR